jgi:hypothetical protein
MNLTYCYQKLSEALNEMCLSTQSLEDRLRSSISRGFTAFPVETFPEGLREQFSEIKSALAGVRIPGHIQPCPDPIDRMRSTEVKRLIGRLISLRDGVAEEYYRRAFQRSDGDGKDNTTWEDGVRQARQLLGR